MGIGAHYPQFRFFFRDLILEIGTLTKKVGDPQKFSKVREKLVQAVEFHNGVKE